MSSVQDKKCSKDTWTQRVEYVRIGMSQAGLQEILTEIEREQTAGAYDHSARHLPSP